MAKTARPASPSSDPRPPAFPAHTHTLRVRYAETDQAGVAHHAAYLPWFEEGRVAFLRALGKPYRELEAEGMHFPVREVQCRYRAVALFDDVLSLTTTLEAVGGASIRFGYRIIRPADDRSIAEGATRHACVDHAGRVKRMPRELQAVLGRRP